jgi:hypothetical protein
MFEYQDIFANHLTTAIFIYATVAMLLINAGLALTLALGRQDETPRRARILHRAFESRLSI